jgi:hypothetical protein
MAKGEVLYGKNIWPQSLETIPLRRKYSAKEDIQRFLGEIV